ncbi:MAG: TasA family protein [Candidatus Saccharibacteria bacterium]|nr:TasA family protein [Candidatus Saccharibacteria bacterium]
MKRIALSLMTIAVVLTMSIAATGAYFSDTAVVRGNTFSTGSVKIGNVSGNSISVTNLVPGDWTGYYPFNVPYIGSINADIYTGVTGANPGTPSNEFADKLTVDIYSYDTGTAVWSGLAKDLSGNWLKVASNVAPNATKHYGIRFMLDPNVDDTYQNINNIDTTFLIYAVQANGPAPGSIGIPYGFKGNYY